MKSPNENLSYHKFNIYTHTMMKYIKQSVAKKRKGIKKDIKTQQEHNSFSLEKLSAVCVCVNFRMEGVCWAPNFCKILKPEKKNYVGLCVVVLL